MSITLTQTSLFDNANTIIAGSHDTRAETHSHTGSGRSKFSPTKHYRPCQVCGDTSGDCRESDSGLILCTSVSSKSDSPLGWTFTGMTQNGRWGMIAPSRADDDQYLSPLERRVQADERRAEREAKAVLERAEWLKGAKTLEARDATLRGKSSELSIAHQRAILDRGMHPTFLVQMESEGLLWEAGHGFGIGALDLQTGYIVGGQIARDDRSPKYVWALPGQVALPETGENPLFPFIHESLDRKLPVEVCLCEGALKPMISASKAWGIYGSGNTQQIWIGAAGGNFSPNALKRVLDAIGLNRKYDFITLYPDAGAVLNPSVISSYTALQTLEPSLRVAWWDQWTKADGDCDEIGSETAIQFITWKEFTSLTLGIDRPSVQNWKASLVFTPDRTFNTEYVSISSPKVDGFLALKSGLGTGKTQWFLDTVMPQYHGAVVIAPTTALCDNVNERASKAGVEAGTIGSLTAKGATEALRNDSKLWTLCPDSILSIEPHEMVGKVLMIDEAMECFTAFLSRPTEIQKYRKAAIERFTELMDAAAAVVIADGNLTDRACQWYQALCPSKSLEKVQNLQGKTMTYRLNLGGGEAFTSHIGHHGNGKWLLGTDSRTDAMALSEYPLTRDTCKTGKVDGEGVLSDDWAQLAMRSASDFIKTYKPHNMAYSPVAGSGWDVSGADGYFDKVYGYYCGVVGPKAITQSLARYRDFTTVRDIWVRSTGMPNLIAVDSTSTSQADILKSVAQFLTDTAESLIGQADNPAILSAALALLTTMQSDPTSIAFVHEDASNNFETQHLRGCLIYLLIQSGHKVQLVAGKNKREDCTIKEVKRAHRLSHAAQIIGSEIITKSEADRIRQASRVAPGRQAALEKFTLSDRLPGITVTPQWTSTELDEVTEERLADQFVIKLPDLASAAENFYLLSNLEVSKKRGQARYQKFLNDGWIDLSKVKTSYSKAAKLRAELGSDFEGMLSGPTAKSSQLGVASNPLPVTVTDDIPKTALYKKNQILKMVKNLINAHGVFPKMGRRSPAKYLADVLGEFGVKLTAIEGTEDHEISLPCLESGSDLNTVYNCAVKRFVQASETDKPHVWLLPCPALLIKVEEPDTAPSEIEVVYEFTYEPEVEAVTVSEDWTDFIAYLESLSSIDFQAVKIQNSEIPEWVWDEAEFSDF